MNASTPIPLKATVAKPARLNVARLLRGALPGVSLAVLLVVIFVMQPRAMSYMGMNLMFNLAVPIALATIAQMLIITVNDLDLSLGSFISFVACVCATVLNQHPLLGCLAPKVLSMLTSKYRNNAAPQMPGTLEKPPPTEVPPITTTAMEASRYSSPMLSEAPPEKPASNTPHRLANTALST